MVKARVLTERGLQHFREWLAVGSPGATPPAPLIDDDVFAQRFADIEIDETRQFASRFEFGKYLCEVLSEFGRDELLAPDRDGLWAWLAVVYFKQLAPVNVRREEHYIVVRRGAAGSLTHRQAARTAYLLVDCHGDAAAICLHQSMHVHGQLLESLSAKQSVALNRGFFHAAALLYMHEGRLRRGATSKPKKPAERKPGDKSGMGSVRRLPLALERLDQTYDVECLDPAELVARLPREFSRWRR